MVINKKAYTAIAIILLLFLLIAGGGKFLSWRDSSMIFEITENFLNNHKLDKAISLNKLLYYNGNSRGKCFVVSFKVNDISEIRDKQIPDLASAISTFEKNSALSPTLNPSAYDMIFLRNNYSLIPSGDSDSQFFPMPFSAMLWGKISFVENPKAAPSDINKTMLFFNKKEGLFYGIKWTPGFTGSINKSVIGGKQKEINDNGRPMQKCRAS